MGSAVLLRVSLTFAAERLASTRFVVFEMMILDYERGRLWAFIAPMSMPLCIDRKLNPGGGEAVRPGVVSRGNPVNHRPLKKIEAELATALECEVKYVIKATGQLIKTGGLLAEAKEQLDEHGAWLPWLKDNFPRTPRTAQNYMAVYALMVEFKCETVSHLNLSRPTRSTPWLRPIETAISKW